MNDEEVNKIIAGYINQKIVKRGHYWFLLDEMGELYPVYTKSLDALVPVWEKLGDFSDFRFYRQTNSKYFWHFTGEKWCVIEDTLQRTAAYATAKMILELRNE